MTLISFDRILIIHVSMLSPLSPKQSKTEPKFFHSEEVFLSKKTFYSYLLLSLSSYEFLVKVAGLFKKIVTLVYLSKID